MAGPNNFLVIIGAPKSGTTTLAALLDQHPAIVLGSEKEPRFFTDFVEIPWTGPGSEGFLRTLVSEEAAYLSLFADKEKPDAAWAIDASTDYLWCDAAPDRIAAWARRFPTKVICILRDPVERAISEYQHTLRDGYEDRDLITALDLEAERMANHWHPLFYHLRRSSYSAPLARYRQLFRDDLLVLGFHELRDPVRVTQRVTQFLGLPDAAIEPGVHLNTSYVYRNETAARLMTSGNLRNLARRIVPKGVRSTVRKMLLPALTQPYAASPADLARLDRDLGDEIRTCRDNPEIPTGGWRSIERLDGARQVHEA